jgi:simple sugar transport system ATP-binding protein
MRHITKRFPGVLANDAVDFEARVGEVHALLGENGAGKSTLSNILTGLYRPDEGEIELRGEPVRFQSPRDAIDAGIGMVHQHFHLVEPFTVAENIVLGEHRPEARSFVIRPRSIEKQVSGLGDRYHLGIDPRARVWQLSIGEQQRVEILKVLYREAKILILDEPTAVLTPQEADALFATLRQMADEGRTVIFISHKLHEVKAVSDRVTVLRGGRAVATRETVDATPRELAALMVGREVELSRRIERAVPPGEDAALNVANVSVKGDRGEEAVRDISFVIRGGEILGVAGVAGNGQRELAEAITGLRAPSQGSLLVHGRSVRVGDPRAAIEAGVAHVPEDRLGTGVASSLSIAENAVLKSYRERPASRGPILSWRAIRANAHDLIERYRVAAPGAHARARDLSGGNLQKLVLGREFAGKPRVLIAASPTRGLDVGAIETVHAYLREAASEGVGILLISEDLDEVMALSDRVVVMYEGALTGEFDPGVATIEEIGLAMAGGERP